MARITGPLLALLFAAVMNAPSLYLLQFTVHKAYVERELCVQRDVMEDMRTCHGECQLTKKFRALEEESNSRFPADRLEIRYEVLIGHAVITPHFLPSASRRTYPVFVASIATGHQTVPEAVPWG